MLHDPYTWNAVIKFIKDSGNIFVIKSMYGCLIIMQIYDVIVF
jgi:hypothetical protein